MESTGQAKAEAQSRAEAAKIEGEAAVEQAKLKSQASKIESVSEIGSGIKLWKISLFTYRFSCLGIRVGAADTSSRS